MNTNNHTNLDPAQVSYEWQTESYVTPFSLYTISASFITLHLIEM
jgi:hypothetical protein